MARPVALASRVERYGWFEFCVWEVGDSGYPRIVSSCWAPDLGNAKRHFGPRHHRFAVNSRASLRVMGRLPVTKDLDEYGRRDGKQIATLPRRKASCEAEQHERRSA